MTTSLQPLMSSAKHDWRTPSKIIEVVHELSGGNWFDMCTDTESYKAMKHKPRAHVTLRGLHVEGKFQPRADGGTVTDEIGFSRLVWCNPPYGRGIDEWIARWSDTDLECLNALILVPARTDTRWFNQLARECSSLLLIQGRLHFSDQKNPAPFPSMIGMRGELGFLREARASLKAAGFSGWHVQGGGE